MVVERGDPRGLIRGEQRAGQAAAIGIKVGAHAVPVGGADAFLPPAQLHAAGGDHAASRASRGRLASAPPREPPMLPAERTTRWHGTTTGLGLVAQALPTARTALGFPARRAMAA